VNTCPPAYDQCLEVLSTSVELLLLGCLFCLRILLLPESLEAGLAAAKNQSLAERVLAGVFESLRSA
jgi:hypothetical protein